MLALAAAVLLTVAAADTATLVPGTSLRFGLPLPAVEARGFRQPGAIAGLELEGPVRFFGLGARAMLTFEDSLLVRAVFDVDSATDFEGRYIEDDLRRQGWRRECRTLSDAERSCDWAGRGAHVALRIAGGAIHAQAERMSAAVAAASSLPASAPLRPAGFSKAPGAAPPASSPPIDTLRFIAPLRTEGFPAPKITWTCKPKYPPDAAAASIQGRVLVHALIDEQGAIVRTVIARSIRPLDKAAIAALSCVRIPPFVVHERPVPFWIEIPVVFTLH